jgi:NADPH:quinone reductase-like Zn-dependent oxidoreductase
MPSNTAAWLTERAAPLEVKPAPYEPPCENEIVIKTNAVAINPVDWAIQARGESLFPWIIYPCILGGDVAELLIAIS